MGQQSEKIPGSSRARLWAAVGICMVASVILVQAIVPLNTFSQRSRIPTKTGQLSPLESSLKAEYEKRQLILDWPAKMREKDSAIISLSINSENLYAITATASLPGQPGVELPVNIPNIYDTHNIVAIARLDLAGVEAFREEMREPLLPDRSVNFRWSIRANEPGIYRGVVWLHLDLVPKDGGESSQVLLLARQIEINVITVFGLPGSLARVVGAIGLALSTALGYPFLQEWVKNLGQKRKRRKPPWQSNSASKQDKNLR